MNRGSRSDCDISSVLMPVVWMTLTEDSTYLLRHIRRPGEGSCFHCSEVVRSSL